MLEEKLDEIAGSMAEIAECLKVMLASEIFTNLPAPKKATRRDKRKDKIEEMLEVPNAKAVPDILPEVPQAKGTELVNPAKPDVTPKVEAAEVAAPAVVNPHPDLPAVQATPTEPAQPKGPETLSIFVGDTAMACKRADVVSIRAMAQKLFTALMVSDNDGLRMQLRESLKQTCGVGTINSYDPDELFDWMCIAGQILKDAGVDTK
jgi:hypothetical protein